MPNLADLCTNAINQLFGLATAKIFCSPPGCMLVESSGDIDSDAGVKRVVGTEDDIDGPVYGSIKSVERPLFGSAIHGF
jgi:hypothetical protein